MNATPIQTTETAVYLVCVAKAGTLHAPDLPGIEPGTSPCVVNIGVLDALVIDVPCELFLADDAEERLKDVSWLTPRAERHEKLVRAAMSQACVMPIGFGSVFSSVELLIESLAEHEASIGEFLVETDGATEWSLKLWTSRAGAIRRAKQEITQEHEDRVGSGTAYLLARRLNDDAIKLAEDTVLGHAEDLIEHLGETILDAAERHASQPEDEPDRWLVAHIALLIENEGMPEFDARLDSLAADFEALGIDLELSGPWPPYSFCPRFGDDEEGED